MVRCLPRRPFLERSLIKPNLVFLFSIISVIAYSVMVFTYRPLISSILCLSFTSSSNIYYSPGRPSSPVATWFFFVFARLFSPCVTIICWIELVSYCAFPLVIDWVGPPTSLCLPMGFAYYGSIELFFFLFEYVGIRSYLSCFSRSSLYLSYWRALSL